MELLTLAAAATVFLVYAIVSGKLEGTILTAPLLFAATGFLIGPDGFGMTGLATQQSILHVVAELTLVLVLFADAARIDLGVLRRDHNLPFRMLGVGLPLTIGLGALVALAVLPQFTIWEAALLAALLAPTDAALGHAVISNRTVPIRIRQSINIESGLNDGIALPAVLMFAALAAMAGGDADSRNWLQFGLLQITIGPLVGIGIGYVGTRAIDRAAENGWVAETFQGIAILALAGLCYVVAEMVGGNGFIAAFVGGMVFGASVRHECTFLFEFMETEGQLLMLITFFVFGAALLPAGLALAEPRYFVYALLSLTVIRMLPIALSLAGSRLRLPSFLFLGWFGPRGLASILFVLLILEKSEATHKAEILSVTVITVALSILLHGVSAAPLARRYGRFAMTMGEREEMKIVTTVPLRTGMAD